jgi:hypothetical protein
MDEQWDLFLEIQKEFSKFSNKINLEKYIKDDRWNICKTKIIDNMIIGIENYKSSILERLNN